MAGKKYKFYSISFDFHCVAKKSVLFFIYSWSFLPLLPFAWSRVIKFPTCFNLHCVVRKSVFWSIHVFFFSCFLPAGLFVARSRIPDALWIVSWLLYTFIHVTSLRAWLSPAPQVSQGVYSWGGAVVTGHASRHTCLYEVAETQHYSRCGEARRATQKPCCRRCGGKALSEAVRCGCGVEVVV